MKINTYDSKSLKPNLKHSSPIRIEFQSKKDSLKQTTITPISVSRVQGGSHLQRPRFSSSVFRPNDLKKKSNQQYKKIKSIHAQRNGVTILFDFFLNLIGIGAGIFCLYLALSFSSGIFAGSGIGYLFLLNSLFCFSTPINKMLNDLQD